ncbi:inorganic phosphate transporter [Psychromicrobium xiongbiense]|uniref:inorganic phosphate transporter n=1 Tax=Psychromicrobium xiongbiense TaxID=3051184 RepID=UPI00255543EC|nr:inorganic phosphate transporter [Psychromicrobium sp. YIM S02556]
MALALLVVVCLLAAAFTVLNGVRDASAAVALAVRTRALTPTVAVVLAGAFNLLGAALSGGFALSLHDQLFVLRAGPEGLTILLGAFLAASIWGAWQWRIGYPSSSTHGLIGGIAGAAGASLLKGYPPMVGLGDTLVVVVVLPLLISPILAFVLSYLLVYPVMWLSRYAQPNSINRRFRRAQAVATTAVAFGHGLQDGSRVAALMVFAFIAVGVPATGSLLWVFTVLAGVFLCAGTLLGGWRISYMLSERLVRVDPLRGLVSQVVSATMLLLGGIALHLPLATTQLTTASVIGVGTTHRLMAANWRLTLKIVSNWLLTPVVCALGAAIFYLALSPLI